MPVIDYFFSLMSPFTYLAGMRLEQIAARHGARIVYRPTDLTKVMPVEACSMPSPTESRLSNGRLQRSSQPTSFNTSKRASAEKSSALKP